MNKQIKIEPASTLYGALARAQAILAAPSKNREVSVKMKSGGTYKFKYATLDHLIEHVRPALTENGLWFVQKTEPGAMVTRITHESGEFLDSAVPMPNLPNSPQEAGSVLTYFRRYSLAIALGLASDEDDDANVAEGNGYEQRKEPAFPEGPASGITALKTWQRNIWPHIEAATDKAELEEIIEQEKAYFKQASNLPEGSKWRADVWEGDGEDNIGLRGLVNLKRQELEQPNILQAG